MHISEICYFIAANRQYLNRWRQRKSFNPILCYCGGRDVEWKLLQVQHLLHICECTRTDSIGIDPTWKYAGIEGDQLHPHFLKSIHEFSYSLTEDVVYIEAHKPTGRQDIAECCGWIEGIRIILY